MNADGERSKLRLDSKAHILTRNYLKTAIAKNLDSRVNYNK